MSTQTRRPVRLLLAGLQAVHPAQLARLVELALRAGRLVHPATLIALLALAGCLPHAGGPATPSRPNSSPEGRPLATASWQPLAVDKLISAAAAPTPGAGEPAPGAIRVYSDGMIGLYVPAGEFIMGTAADVPVEWPDERPQHEVYLNGFWIDRTEVTNAQYAGCVQAKICPPPAYARSYRRSQYFGVPAYDDFPVIYVSWPASQQYCQWAGRRLPTEAEWEKAARGTDGRLHAWGNELPDATRGNAGNDLGDTTAVGSYPAGASPYGALDMAGNVWEWVADLYNGEYYQNSPLRNPLGPGYGNSRLVRGGSWWVAQRTTTSAERSGYGYRATEDRVGFRCAVAP